MQAMIALKKFPLKNLALAGLMALGSSAALASSSCTLTPASPNTNFTINNLLDVTAGDPSLKQTIPFRMDCTKRNIYINGGFCLKLGLGSAGTPVGTAYAPRWLQKGSDYLGFQIYKDAGYSTVWGPNANAPAQQIRETMSMSGSTIFTDWPITEIGAYPLHVELLSTFPTVAGVSTIQMLAPGTYSSTFNSGNNTYYRLAFGLGTNADCSNGGENSGIQSLNFTVTAVINPQCKITTAAADIDFGTQSGAATNLQGSTAVGVRCTRTTPYYIGLRPGNGNTAGAGVMSAISPVGNTDTVPYQLRQAAGMSGAIWGDTATTSSAGNGVAGTGLGSSASNYTIYATVPSANSAAGNYQDTVTMTVHY